MNGLDAVWHLSVQVKEAMPFPQLSCSVVPLRSQCGCRRPTGSHREAHGWPDILIAVLLIPTATLVILIIRGE